ncbi:uncharacterized protein [Littorina saxatilis]|uniref:uncharacterized protein isoform X2 n=1 Tax=Littorina saxatilis TaxID=31220 RepID=UPI0038B5F86A
MVLQHILKLHQPLHHALEHQHHALEPHQPLHLALEPHQPQHHALEPHQPQHHVLEPHKPLHHALEPHQPQHHVGMPEELHRVATSKHNVTGNVQTCQETGFKHKFLSQIFQIQPGTIKT